MDLSADRKPDMAVEREVEVMAGEARLGGTLGARGLVMQTQPPGGGERSWGHLRHGSDIGVWGRGRTREEAFERAGVALCAVMTEPARVEPREVVEVRCEAPDVEVLFTDWLNALVYEMSARRMLFSRFEVHLEDGRLEGRAWGEAVDVARHEPAVEVKAATLTGLEVRREEDGGWYAQCVVDV